MKNSICLFLLFSSAIGLAQLPQLKLVQFAQGLNKPVDIKHCKDSRLFFVERNGAIRILTATGSLVPTAFMNISNKVNSTGGEQGLLAMAFSPNYKTDGYFFVNYIKGSGSGNSIIARYSVSALDSNLADTATEQIILQFPQPYNNHNGCDLRFGPDGYLYASFGDGGSGGDPQNYGQNTNSFLGKILRIDPFSGATYTVPSDNPFFGQAGKKEEIWAYGLRNPWRCSFDRLTGDYWIGDVGQNVLEEINFQAASSAGGENYGWRCYEGNSVYNASGCSTLSSNYTFPVYQYSHSGPNGCSVTGGMVYRGAQFQKMFGYYFFTDYCSGRIWATKQSGSVFTTSVLSNYLTYQYSSFGEDQNGELYLAGLGNGRIYHLRDTSDCKPVAFLGFQDSIVACGSAFTLSALQGPGLSYAWSLNGNAIATATLPTLTATQSGIYVLSVTNSLACSAQASLQVSLNNATALNIVGLQNQYCLEEEGDSLKANVSGAVFTINSAITNGYFNPMLLGQGTHSVVCSYTNNLGCVSSSSQLVNVSLCTELGEWQSPAFRFRLYPNPGKGIFNLQADVQREGKAVLFIQDLSGRELYYSDLLLHSGRNTLELDLNGLAEGLYLIQLSNADHKQVLRLMKH